jgi:hypothetical protein
MPTTDEYVPWDPSQGPPPVGNIDAWADFLTGRLDPRINRNQWRAWINEVGVASDCPPDKPFKSMRGNLRGREGECVEKPVDCPEGMFLHGENCYNEGETPGGFGVEGQVGGAPAQPTSDGLLHAPAPGAGPKSDLQRQLEEAFLGRKGMFGWANARNPMSGIAGDLVGKALGGGGLWWGGDKGMFDEATAAGGLPTKTVPTTPPIQQFTSLPGQTAPTIPGQTPIAPVAPAQPWVQGAQPRAQPRTPAAPMSPLANTIYQKYQPKPWWQLPQTGVA